MMQVMQVLFMRVWVELQEQVWLEARVKLSAQVAHWPKMRQLRQLVRWHLKYMEAGASRYPLLVLNKIRVAS